MLDKISTAKKYAKATGVIDLSERHDLSQDLRAIDERLARLKRAIPGGVLACKQTVLAVARCVGFTEGPQYMPQQMDQTGPECQTPEVRKLLLLLLSDQSYLQ